MKDFYIADAARHEGAVVTTYFALSQLQVRERKGANAGQYLALTLSDKTGSFEARMWEEFAEALETCGEGCYVKVQGQVAKYQGKFQITVAKMRSASSSEVDPVDFVPVSDFPIPQMEAELRAVIAGFGNPDLRRLVLSFLDDPAIGPAFFEAPAAKLLHHAWLGGLLEHVLTLCKILRALAPFYPEADPDLVLTGAILHDIGKVRELSWHRTFSYTLEGQLIGHISIAQRMLADKLRDLQPFPEKLAILIEHMILAHHGRLEFGSPKLPMTPEALLFSAIDDLEAKFAAMRREFAAASGSKPDQPTEWIRSMERPLFNSQRWLDDTPAIPSKVASSEPARSEPIPSEPVPSEPAPSEPVPIAVQNSFFGS